MKSKTLLTIVEKLEALASKLPGPLQRPILEELTPVKELFLLARPPRILFLGAAEVDETAVVNGLFNAPTARMSEMGGNWRTLSKAGRGALRFLDGRAPVALEVVTGALLDEPADAILLCSTPDVSSEKFSAAIERAAEVIRFAAERKLPVPCVIGVQTLAEGNAVASARQALHASLHTSAEVSRHVAATVELPSFVRFRHDGTAESSIMERAQFDVLAELLSRELPLQSRLEMARLSGVRSVQAEIGKTLVKSITAICGAIGAQPIPLADFPVLTALQGMMVAGVVHISGREWSVATASRFIGALGANMGAGLIFRETARAAVKILPGWGNAISGGIAGLGTYAVGKAAIAYFIEGASIEDAKKLWKRTKKKQGELSDSRPPESEDRK